MRCISTASSPHMFLCSILLIVAWTTSSSFAASAFCYSRSSLNAPSLQGRQQPLRLGSYNTKPVQSTTTITVPLISSRSKLLHPSFVRTTLPFSKSTTLLQQSVDSVVTSIASSPFGAIAVLATIVLVHESGHYLAARYFQMQVEEFSIGIGPKVFGFHAWGNDFSLRVLPLGGYVRFPENYNSTLVQQQQKAARQKAKMKTRKPSKNSWTILRQKQKILNILTFGKWKDRQQPQQPTQQQQQQQNKKSVLTKATESWNRNNYFLQSTKTKRWWWPFGNNINNNNRKKVTPTTTTTLAKLVDTDDVDDDDDLEDFEIEYYDDPNLLQNRPWTERAVVLSAGVLFNLLLSFSIYFGSIYYFGDNINGGVGVGGGLPQPIFDSGVMVTAAPLPNGPAVGLLQKGDVITSVNGKPLRLSKGTSIPAAQKQVSDVISSIRSTPDGENVQFEVLRSIGTSSGSSDSTSSNGKVSTTTTTTTTITIMTTTAKQTQTVSIRPTRRSDDASKDSPPSIGVFLSPNMARVERLRSNNPFIAAQMAWKYLVDVFLQTLNGILGVLGTFLFQGWDGRSSPVGQSISGPIGLIKQGTTVVSTKDWTAVLLFTAALSINLAVINALPLPALDGGQLVFVLAEAITGRKVDQRLQEGITSVAVLLLLWISVSAAIGDVGNILSGVL